VPHPSIPQNSALDEHSCIANFKYTSHYTPSHTGVLWVLVVSNVQHDDLHRLSSSAKMESSLKDSTLNQNLLLQTLFSGTPIHFLFSKESCLRNLAENAAEYGEF
jgi:hypothetical protein